MHTTHELVHPTAISEISRANVLMNSRKSDTLVVCEFCGYMFRHVRSLELKLLSVGPIPEACVNCATHDASYLPGYFVPVVQMQVPEQDIYRNMYRNM